MSWRVGNDVGAGVLRRDAFRLFMGVEAGNESGAGAPDVGAGVPGRDAFWLFMGVEAGNESGAGLPGRDAFALRGVNGRAAHESGAGAPRRDAFRLFVGVGDTDVPRFFLPE